MKDVNRVQDAWDCHQEARYVAERNVNCSNALLAALREHHGPPAENNEPEGPSELPPIPNDVIATAAEIAFPEWVNSIKRIQHAVCKEYGVSLLELCSHRRKKAIVRPRQVAMYLCKTLTDRSFPEIGRRFGGRDHTTVISAISRVEQICAADEEFRARVQKIALGFAS